MAHRIPSEFALESDLTIEERRIVAERAKIRAGLRKEYLRKVMDPYQPHGPLVDPALLRYQAAKATYWQFQKITPKAVSYWVGLVVLPTVLFTWTVMKDMNAYERKCRSGEIPYEKRFNRGLW